MYIVPQVLVYQELEVVPAANVAPLYACVVGPHFDLIRYTEATEKQRGALGAYDLTQETCYLWPNRPAGAIVDDNWTKLYADDAWLKYWSNPSIMTIPASGDSNRVVASAVNFKTYGIWTRDATLKSRDVQAGDGVRIRGTGISLAAYDLLTRVTGFEHEEVAAVVSAATADDDNQVAAVAAASGSQTAGAVNDITMTEDGSAYNGLEDGYVAETYTVEVTQGGVPTVARMKVTSLSGTDNVASLTPSAFGVATDIGTRGLTAIFSVPSSSSTSSNSSSSASSLSSSSNSSSSTGSAAADGVFILGQEFEIDVQQTYDIPTPTSGGDFTGPSDTSYVVTVNRGGDLNELVEADKPIISVSTTTGIDFGGPYPVNKLAAVTLGNYGVTITLTGDDLLTGDRFIIPVAAEADGAVRTLVLANAIPDDLLGQEVSLDLSIRGDVEIPLYQLGITTNTNYSQSATEICVEQNIQLTDSGWYEPGTGALIPIDLFSGGLFVEYRSLLQTYATHTHTFTLATMPDQVTPDNPFAYGLFKALSNSNGTVVRGMAVPADDFAGYQVAINDLSGRDDVYGLVPLTWDRQTQNLFAAHVDELSSPENGRWRVAWLNSEAVEELGVYIEDAEGDPLLATIVDDDTTSGTQYTKVIIEDGLLLTEGVIASDIVRVNYGSDDNGNATYESYVIDRVVSEDLAILVTGPDAAINVPSKLEIWRNLTKDEIATDFGQISGTFGNRRDRHIWPDWIGDSGTNVQGYFLCAALSGLRSGVAPHQGLTNVEIAGFDDVRRTTEFFGKPQLDTMAEAGTWIVTQDFETGQVYSRHQLTTGDYTDQNQREDSITSNLDSISIFMLAQFAPYIGKANVTPEFIGLLEIVLGKALDTFTESTTQTLGPQIITYEITEIRQHEVLRDRVVATVELTLPSPFNNFELHLVI